MICSSIPVSFVEPDLTVRVPSCVPYIAAALAAGWRLANDGHPNHQDVLEGVAHLQDFKRASERKLRRVITFRFRPQTLLIEGDKNRLEQFIERCQTDAAFFRAAQDAPKYKHWWDQLITKLPAAPRHLCATEPEAHGRVVTIPFGCPADWAVRFARMYENGF